MVNKFSALFSRKKGKGQIQPTAGLGNYSNAKTIQSLQSPQAPQSPQSPPTFRPPTECPDNGETASLGDSFVTREIVDYTKRRTSVKRAVASVNDAVKKVFTGFKNLSISRNPPKSPLDQVYQAGFREIQTQETTADPSQKSLVSAQAQQLTSRYQDDAHGREVRIQLILNYLDMEFENALKYYKDREQEIGCIQLPEELVEFQKEVGVLLKLRPIKSPRLSLLDARPVPEGEAANVEIVEQEDIIETYAGLDNRDAESAQQGQAEITFTIPLLMDIDEAAICEPTGDAVSLPISALDSGEAQTAAIPDPQLLTPKSVQEVDPSELQYELVDENQTECALQADNGADTDLNLGCLFDDHNPQDPNSSEDEASIVSLDGSKTFSKSVSSFEILEHAVQFTAPASSHTSQSTSRRTSSSSRVARLVAKFETGDFTLIDDLDGIISPEEPPTAESCPNEH